MIDLMIKIGLSGKMTKGCKMVVVVVVVVDRYPFSNRSQQALIISVGIHQADLFINHNLNWQYVALVIALWRPALSLSLSSSVTTLR